MKCIIADDEHLVRFSILDMLEEIADAGILWFEEISQAVDGQDLLGKSRSHSLISCSLISACPGSTGWMPSSRALPMV